MPARPIVTGWPFAHVNVAGVTSVLEAFLGVGAIFDNARVLRCRYEHEDALDPDVFATVQVSHPAQLYLE